MTDPLNEGTKAMPNKGVTGIKATFQVTQGTLNAMMNPELGGKSIEEINQALEAGKNCEIGAVFRSISDADTSYSAPCAVKAFKGTISLSDNMLLTIEGEGQFDAHAYAIGLIEDEGSAEVWFTTLNVDGIELEFETESDEPWVKISTVN